MTRAADVMTWVQATPFGAIEVVLGPDGLERVSMSDLHHDLWSERGAAHPPADQKSRRVAGQFDAYFAGRRRNFDIDVVLADSFTEFQRQVLLRLRDEVGYGETVTYGELAEIAGRPGAARAVGSTMARNPVPFVIPCHRVVAANGIGGYGGGYGDAVALKRALLDFEAGVSSTLRSVR
ncbi:MAG: methylated-DNA--[protein]-cysteine S-methyltransferase [Acidimicrobiia bacterium]